MPDHVSVKVWGPLACFSRPEMRVERVSYSIMTPSAARGVLDSILYKPQMRWHVRRVAVLRYPGSMEASSPQFLSVRRNEIQGKIAPRTVLGWMADPNTVEPYLVDSAGREGAQGQNRTQRNTLALREVCYRIDATPILTARANMPRQRPRGDDEDEGGDTVAKYVAMFQRRVSKGQCFTRPFLGCREFAADFTVADLEEETVPWTEHLGRMLYDIRFGKDGNHRPLFFDAHVKNGVLHCDTLAPSQMGDPPVQLSESQEIEEEVVR
jgi:CRISPR-associated protein Cas5d